MKVQNAIGTIATAAGIIGIFVSFLIEKSEFDPTAFALSMVSIFIAIVGIALILQQPPKAHHRHKQQRSRAASFLIIQNQMCAYVYPATNHAIESKFAA